MANELVHKPVDLAKVKKARRQILEQPRYLDDNFIAMPKYDGCCAIIHVHKCDGDGSTIRCTSRTGEPVRSMSHVLDNILEHSPVGDFVLFGEAWIHDKDFAYISGKFRQHDNCPELEVVLWDMVGADEYEQGCSRSMFSARLYDLGHYFGGWWADHVRVAAYYDPLYTTIDCRRLAQRYVELGGYDGLIMADPDGFWIKGNGTGGEKIKIKPSLSFDLEVVGTAPGKGKHEGRIGNLIVRYKDGKLLGVGTGLSDADRERDDWVGKIIEVEAMGHSNDGSLREPRMKAVRHDKEQADF